MHLYRFTAALLIGLTALPICAGELLDSIVKNMGNIQSIQSRFIQEKQLKNFAFPLKISGVMCADQIGDRFAWRVEKPMISNCIITGKKLIQYDGDSGKTLEISAEGNPALKMLSDTLRMLFAGNIKAMLKDFTIAQEKNPLTLTPSKHSPFAAFISSITFTFSPDLRQIEQIRMEEKSGDVTRIEFTGTAINTPIKESLWQAQPQKD